MDAYPFTLERKENEKVNAEFRWFCEWNEKANHSQKSSDLTIIIMNKLRCYSHL